MHKTNLFERKHRHFNRLQAGAIVNFSLFLRNRLSVFIGKPVSDLELGIQYCELRGIKVATFGEQTIRGRKNAFNQT
jgi:hypothetical protein